MLENRIKRIIISTAAIDAINDNDNKFRSCEVQVMISTIKSLIPSLENNGVKINYDRYKKELELLNYYFDKNKKSGSRLNRVDYWSYEDKTFTSRIIPIVIANEDYETAKKEIIKNILYSTGNINILLNGILLGKLLDYLIKNQQILYDDILSKLKNEIIAFSQTKFLEEYRDHYRKSLDEYSGNFLVDFERNRIKLINILNEIESKNINILKKSLCIIKNKEDILIEKIKVDDLYVSAMLGVYLKKISEKKYNDRNFIEKISDYLIKLRKGRIDSRNLKVKIYSIPDLFKYDVGKEINHPLLNRCQIVKRYNHNESIVIEVVTKSGLYKFKRNNTL
ncbi:hypothetical protein GOQ29_06725 [Clostridium sp. D2Q-14]|uniref:hypothetical protein n=1 Tax=Anaeromonas gelatinilytica TaxID=2683194 RepID=UPI00193BFA46|nr:hypothetical protein [Anaeromonas gelatinilytica]MBS4535310.1 hypothetical protein [Anaeromonas gelatinilytica]